MGRYRPSGSYGHHIELYSAHHEEYEIYWTYDRYYPDSRQRFPQTQSRTTDKAGALRFAKKWNVQMPEERPEC